MSAEAGRLRRGGAMRSLWHIQSELPSAARWRRGIALGFGEAVCQAIPVGVVVIVTGRLRDGALSTTDAWACAVVCAIALVGQAVFRRLAYDNAWLAGTALSAELRLRVLDHLRRLPMSYHRRQPAGDSAAALTQDMFHIDMFVLEAVPRVAGNLALCVLILGVLLAVDPPLALCVAVSLLAAVPVLRHNQRTLARLSTERQQLAADATARVVEYVQGIAVVRAFDQTGPVQRRLRSTLDDYRAINAKMAVKTSPLFGAFEATVGLGVPLVVAASSYWLFEGRIDAGTALVFLVVVLRVYEPIIQINDVSERLRMADASLDRIAALLDAPGQQEPAVLRTPQGFAVEFDGVDFSCDLSSEQLFDAVSVVFQDVYLLNATIFDNIAFGRRDASIDDVIAAARAACCHDFIAALPEGYDTLVGEGGQTVSGGERQRISIARAILKDAPIVLLDEATAALDPINERLIARALAALSTDKTLLVIAHRLSTIRSADQIIVLEGGSIVQRGTHDALIAQPGLYARFWGEREKAAGWRLSPQHPVVTG